MDRWQLLEERLQFVFTDLDVELRDPLVAGKIYDLRHLSVIELVTSLLGAAAPGRSSIEAYFAIGHRFLPEKPLAARHLNALFLWAAWADFAANWRPPAPFKW